MGVYNPCRSPGGETVRGKFGCSWQAVAWGSLWALAKRAWILLLLLAVGYFVGVTIDPGVFQKSRNAPLALLLLALFSLPLLRLAAP